MQRLTIHPPPTLSDKLPLTFDVWGFCVGNFFPLSQTLGTISTEKNLVISQVIVKLFHFHSKMKKDKIQTSKSSATQKLGLKIPSWVNSICLASAIPILGLQLFTDSHPVVKLITTVVIFFLVSQLITNRNPLRQKFCLRYKDWGIEWEIDKEGCQPPDTSN